MISWGWLKGDGFFSSCKWKTFTFFRSPSSPFQCWCILLWWLLNSISRLLFCRVGWVPSWGDGWWVKCRIVISPCLALSVIKRFSQCLGGSLKPNAGFHFEPRDKRPVLQIKVELNYLLTQRSGQRVSARSQSSLSEDLSHFFPTLQCSFLILLPLILAQRLWGCSLPLRDVHDCDLLRLDYQGSILW